MRQPPVVEAGQEVALQVPRGQVSEAGPHPLLPVRQLQVATPPDPHHQEGRPSQFHLPRRGANARI